MTAAPSRGRPRDAAVDSAILHAALDLFIERGVEGTSMEQVARKAGVGKPAVYRRWVAKEELIAAAIETLIVEDSGWASPEAVANESPYDLVEAAIERAAATITTARYRALVARVFGSAVSHPQLMTTYWERYIRPRRLLAAGLLARAQQLGTVAEDIDVEVAIDMMVGAVTYRVLQPHPPDVDEMRRYLRAVYRQIGLLPG